MRRILFLLLVGLLPGLINAQTEKGNFIIAGGAGLIATSSSIKEDYGGKTNDKYTVNSVTIQPSFGYFIMNDLAVILNNTFSLKTTKYEDGYKERYTSNLIVPTAVYYFPAEGSIRPIIQAGIGFSAAFQKVFPENERAKKYSAFGLALNLGGGVAIFIRKNISVNLGLSYTKANLINADDNKSQMKEGDITGNVSIAVYL